MLIIRDEQMQAFQVEADGRFSATSLRELEAHFPSTIEGEDRDAVRVRILEARDAALQFGLSRPADLMTFVALAFVLGPRFHAHPPLRAFLEDPALSSERRLARLMEMVSDEEWRRTALAELP